MINNIITATVKLLPRKEESILRFHPWVFSGAIDTIEGEVYDGALVRVNSQKGEPLGVGHWAEGSIAVRMLSFISNEEIDASFWEARLSAALSLRIRAGLIRSAEAKEGENNVYRLVHGEGDQLPGLVIDVYGNTAVVQAHSMGMHYSREAVAAALVRVYDELCGPNVLSAIYYKSSSTLPTRIARENCEDGFLYGHSEAQAVWENGIQFMPDWLRGQKTGFFVDQRDNRSLVEHYAKGRTLLNAFCYTGGFSLYALRGGAKQVDSLDSSAKAMYLTEEHVRLNFGDCPQHHSITQDAFEYLEQMPEHRYDMIILDPPAFAKHRKVLRNALIGYRRINAQAFRKIAPGGILFTFSCSQAVSKEEFRLAVFTAAAASGRHVRILHQLTQPLDHAVSIYHPEGEYLKGLVLAVD
ncbi:MAG: class I SAM-dependent rRNA methyltransferase [Porphyromonas sp.]|nr:class I SAM-dependent rRNA methyltransferase [Porphyromonas sp.]